LAWAEDEYALRYKVTIEKEDDGEYTEVLQEFTDTFFIEIPLPPGNYRCQVVPYDFLEKPGAGSEWMNFEVKPPVEAPPPESEPQPVPEPPPMVVSVPPPPPPVVLPEENKLFHLYINTAWAPLVPLYEKDNLFIGKSPSLLGAAARLGAIYSGFSVIDIGLEFAGSWYAFDAVHNGNESALYHAATAGPNLVVQKKFPNQVSAIRFRLGGGLLFMADAQPFYAALGASFVWFPFTHFFLETGLDYAHLFAGDASGCLRPHIGAGVQF